MRSRWPRRSHGPVPGRAGPCSPSPISRQDTDWRDPPLIKARLAGGYCLRTAAQGVCAYANICEHCPNYRSEPASSPSFSPSASTPKQVLADDENRGWNDEAKRHRRLVERLDLHMAQTEAS